MLLIQVVIVRHTAGVNARAGRERELAPRLAKSAPKKLRTARMSQLQEELTLTHPIPPPEHIVDTPGWIQPQMSPQ